MNKANNISKYNFIYYLWSFLPVILACFSVVIVFASANINEIIVIYDRLIEVFFLLLSIAIVSILMLYIITLRRLPFHAICNLVAIILFSAFTFAEINELVHNFSLRTRYILILWLFFLVIITCIVYYLSKYNNSTLLLSIFIVFFLSMPLFQISKFYFEFIIAMNEETPHKVEQVPRKIVEFKPNVYYFILDGYVRQDILQNIYKFNNEQFIRNLKNKGFYIADKSIANSNETGHSLTTTFEMDYKFLRNNQNNHHVFDPSVGQSILKSPTLRIFNENNYNIIMADSHIPLAKCDEIVKHCIIGNNFYYVFFLSTPIKLLLRSIQLRFPSLKEFIQSIGESSNFFRKASMDPRYIVDTSLNYSQPYFLFAHSDVAHPPYIYNEDCSRKDVGDIDIFKDTSTTNNDNLRAQYVSQLQCANKQMLEAVDKIIDKDKDAIIIIQSDHGWHTQNQYHTDISSWSKSQYLEWYSVLNALRIPSHCNDVLYPSISPVNTFRVVFSCIGFRRFDLLPDRHFARTIDKNNKYVIKDIYDIQPIFYEQ